VNLQQKLFCFGGDKLDVSQIVLKNIESKREICRKGEKEEGWNSLRKTFLCV